MNTPKSGDRIIVTAETMLYTGETGEIIEVLEDMALYRVQLDNLPSAEIWYGELQFRVIDDGIVPEIGAKVRITKSNNIFHGSLATILSTSYASNGDYRVEIDIDGWCWNKYFKRNQFEIVRRDDIQEDVSWWYC